MRIAPLLFALVLLVPVAHATHGEPPAPIIDDIRAVDRFVMTLRHTHSITLDYHGEETTWVENVQTTHRASGQGTYRSTDVLDGLLTAESEEGYYVHRGAGTRSIHASSDEYRYVRTSSEGWSEEHSTDIECGYVGELHDDILGHMAARILPDGTMRITSVLAHGPMLEDGECHRTTQPGGSDDYPFAVSMRNSVLVPDPARVERGFEITISLDKRTHSLSRSHTFQLPGAETDSLYTLCMVAHVPEYATGSCRLTSTIEVTLTPLECGTALNSFKHHMADLDKAPMPPPGAQELDLLLWWDVEIRPRLDSMLRDVRFLQMLCGLSPEGHMDAIVAQLLLYRDALLELAERDELQDWGIHELLGVTRSLQMLGVEVSFTELVDHLAAVGLIQVDLHSPAALRARDEQGRVSGWVDGEVRLDIPRSTFEGEAGSHQRLTLPAGFYRFEVEEQGEGDFLLDLTWNGTGASGRDSLRGDSLPGRTTTWYVSTDLRGADNKTRFDGGFVNRMATSTVKEFYDAWPAQTFGAVPEAQWTPAAIPGGGSSHDWDGDDEWTDDWDGDDWDPDGGTGRKGSPLGIELVLVALAIVILRRRS